jgi:predicted GIY-YIG superfamily endonuclease
MASRSPVVYLLHFAEPYKHARHYVGYSEQLSKRLAHHQNGTGARLMAAVAEAGIAYQVARVWKGADRTFERRIHNRKHSAQLCPLCAGDSALGRAKVRGAKAGAQ